VEYGFAVVDYSGVISGADTTELTLCIIGFARAGIAAV
jgi:hypothetical protein